MLAHLRPAIVTLLLLTAITGIAYPLALTGLAQLAFPGRANGSLLMRDGTVVGSELIGQAWTSEGYFHGRPSAAGSGYDARASSGSNLGPTSAKLVERIAGEVDRLKAESASPLPADAVTASGSGLDPDISPSYALLQVARVAKARGIGADRVEALVRSAVRDRVGPFGEARVNVLRLNIGLDGLGADGNG